MQASLHRVVRRSGVARALRAWLVCLACLAAPVALQAGLKWTSTSQTLTADPDRTELTAAFEFRNEGASPVTIVEVQTSCDCTAAALEKKTYAAGERGKIPVVLRYTGEVSPLRQTVTVITDEAGGVSHALKLEVAIPARAQRERIDIQPRHVRWKRGAVPRAQVLNVRIRDRDDAIRPVAVASTDPAFRVQLREPRADEPGLYELAITPVTLDAAHEAVVTVTTNSDQLERGSAPIVYRITVTVD